MQRIITILAAIYLISGCANIKGSDYDQLRRAEQAGARITDYSQASAPGGDDVLIGTDVSDTTMSPAGTTKKYRLRDLPVSDPAQAALDAKQDELPGVSPDGSNGINVTGGAAFGEPVAIGSLYRFRGAVAVANIPASPVANDVILVIDGDTPCDTSTGLGEYAYFMRYTGDTWVCAGDGGDAAMQLDGLSDVNGDGNAGYVLVDDGDGTFSFIDLSTVYQSLDSDLTAIAAVSTTAYGRDFLALANQAALVALLPSYQADLDVPSQAEAEAGTSTAERVWTAQKIAQAIAALAPGGTWDDSPRSSAPGTPTTGHFYWANNDDWDPLDYSGTTDYFVLYSGSGYIGIVDLGGNLLIDSIPVSALDVAANVASLLGAADYPTMRTLLSLTALSTTTPGTGIAAALANNVGSTGAPVINGNGMGKHFAADDCSSIIGSMSAGDICDEY